MNNKSILCIGEILWDMLPSGAKAGGAPMNVALHLKKFGFDVNFAGRIGNDRLGNDLKKFLLNQGIDLSLLQVDNELPTSTVEVHLEENNQVRFEIVDNVAWDKIELTHELQKASEAADVIIYGTLASRHSYTRNNILKLIENNNALKLIDVNLRPPFDKSEVVERLLVKADIVKLNDDELKVISEWHGMHGSDKDMAEWFLRRYNPDIICVTRGARGALLSYKGRFVEHPGFRVDVVDTVGSGDAFLAGFLSKYLTGEQIDKALAFACATGAFVATRAGATPDYELNEIYDMIKIN